MAAKITTALIILTIAALCAAAAFQYLEMESFGLPKTLQERFFPAPPPPAPAEESTTESAPAEGGENKPAENAPAENANPAPAPAAQ